MNCLAYVIANMLITHEQGNIKKLLRQFKPHYEYQYAIDIETINFQNTNTNQEFSFYYKNKCFRIYSLELFISTI